MKEGDPGTATARARSQPCTAGCGRTEPCMSSSEWGQGALRPPTCSMASHPLFSQLSQQSGSYSWGQAGLGEGK